MKNIEKAVVPLGWLITAIVFACGGSTATAYFVFNVDARLTRIENKLGIENPVASFVNKAEASGESKARH